MSDLKLLLPLLISGLLAGCANKADDCQRFFSETCGSDDTGPGTGPTTVSDDRMLELTLTDSAGTVSPLDTELYLRPTPDSRWGFFTGEPDPSHVCHMAVTFNGSGDWQPATDTLHFGDVRIEGFYLDQRHEWVLNPDCGETHLPEATAWILYERYGNFADAEGRTHGSARYWRAGVRWGKQRIDARYLTRTYAR